jgi:N-acetylglucosaminyldiphosphoundecaprenol N-acetyl-beta-D-mannosaminyltransferase
VTSLKIVTNTLQAEPLQKFCILGQPVNLSSDYLGWLIDRLDRGISTHAVTMNSEMVMQAKHHPQLAEILQGAELVAADGAGVTLALKLHGIDQQRCAGIDLGEELLQAASNRGASCPVAFYGGKPEVLRQAVTFWQQQLPGLSIVVQQHGYSSADEQQDLLADLKLYQPKIILVALGIPRQEIWINQHRHLCPHSIWVGVGGSFDVWSGTKQRAPRVMQELNLEWLYRFAQEPSRWRRMLALPSFAHLAIQEWWLQKSQSK